MRRGAHEKDRLKALVDGVEWAPLGTSGDSEVVAPSKARGQKRKDPAVQAGSESGRYPDRTGDLLLVRQAL
jgi:hypothetical protein